MTDLTDCVIGIDPGATSPAGVAVVTVSMNPKLLRSLVVKSDISKINETMQTLNRDFRPVLVAIEDQYFQKNVATLIKLARAAAYWEFAAKILDLKTAYISPQTWQSKELSGAIGPHSQREQIKKASICKAHGLWGTLMVDHQSDSALIARYAALELFWLRPVSDEYRAATRKMSKIRKRKK